MNESSAYVGGASHALPITYTQGPGKILVLLPFPINKVDHAFGALCSSPMLPSMPIALLALCVSTLTLLPPAAAEPSPLTATVVSDSAEGDTTALPVQLRIRTSGWGAWAGGSLHASTLIAKTEGARFGLVGLQFGHVLATEDNRAVRFTADLLPIAVLSYPIPPPSRDTAPADDPVSPMASTYGAGAVPIGLQFVYRTDRDLQPFFGGSGGLMYFPDPVPDGRGRKLNYTFDFSAGMRWILGEQRVLTIGYRFHHLSNGFRGEINPGFDANIVFIGLSTM